MADGLYVPSADSAERLFFSILEDNFVKPDGPVSFGDWIVTNVYIPDRDIRSEITPPYMEAFLDLQKQIYTVVAFAKFGVANSRLLTDLDRQQFQIVVKVTEAGSSNYAADLSKSLERCLKVLLEKLDGKQATAVILGLGLLFAAAWGFPAWLDHEKTLRLDESRSKEHIEALRALTLSDERKNEIFNKLIELLEKQGHAGEIAIAAAQSAYESLLKAASKTENSTINGQSLTGGEAAVLRKAVRKASVKKYIIQKVRVVDINTADPHHNTMVLMDAATRDQNRMDLPDNLLSKDDRKKLFSALDTAKEVWAELAVTEADGEIRSVTFLRTVDDPEK